MLRTQLAREETEQRRKETKKKNISKASERVDRVQE